MISAPFNSKNSRTTPIARRRGRSAESCEDARTLALPGDVDSGEAALPSRPRALRTLLERSTTPLRRCSRWKPCWPRGANEKASLVAELARVRDEETLDDAGARAAYERLLKLSGRRQGRGVPQDQRHQAEEVDGHRREVHEQGEAGGPRRQGLRARWSALAEVASVPASSSAAPAGGGKKKKQQLGGWSRGRERAP